MQNIEQQIKQIAQANNWVLTPELIAKLTAFIKLQNKSVSKH